MKTTSLSTVRTVREADGDAVLLLVDDKRRREQWQRMPQGMRDAYGTLNSQVPAACSASLHRRRRRHNVASVALALFFLLVTTNNVQALTRNYNYRFVTYHNEASGDIVLQRINTFMQ